MTAINDLGQSILKSRYYASGESSPEHVFSRVARVVSIPEVMHLNKCSGGSIGGVSFFETFHPYEESAKRVARRDFGMHEDFCISVEYRKILKDCWNNVSNKYYSMMNSLKFMPATPVLMNAGVTDMLSSCFFLRIEDSLEDIFDKMKKAAIIMKRGGGVGFDLSLIRPEGSSISSSKGKSTGPISYLKILNAMGDQVNQGGVRRSAMLASLSVDHPDIEKFVTCKKVEGDISNFNISVKITDEFMRAVKNDGNFTLRHPKSDVVVILKAKDLWDKIAKNAHDKGEPGILFSDTIKKGDIFNGAFGEYGVNPCAEILLYNYASCNLACINLSEFVDEGQFDYESFRSAVSSGVVFLDNMVSVNDYPLPEIEKMSLAERRIGLGVTGLHDALLKMGIEYSSSHEVLHKIFGTMKETAEQTSHILGKTRGVPVALQTAGVSRRNSALLTGQPAGTVSMIMNQVSSGIEPVWKWSYDRKDSFGEKRINHFVVRPDGTVPEYAKSAMEISPEDHVKVLSTIVKYIDNNLSKTVNTPNSATVQDIQNVYTQAYESGCKSVTVYRDGCRVNQVLSSGTAPVTPVVEPAPKETPQESPPKTRERPRVLFGATFRVPTPSGQVYITVNEDTDGRCRELLINGPRAGSDLATHTEAHGRLISNALKYNVPIESMIAHLKGQKSTPVFSPGGMIKSMSDAIALVLEEYIGTFEGFSQFIDVESIVSKPEKSSLAGTVSGDICPECGEPTVYSESGCKSCKNCGYSACA